MQLFDTRARVPMVLQALIRTKKKNATYQTEMSAACGVLSSEAFRSLKVKRYLLPASLTNHSMKQRHLKTLKTICTNVLRCQNTLSVVSIHNSNGTTHR